MSTETAVTCTFDTVWSQMGPHLPAGYSPRIHDKPMRASLAGLIRQAVKEGRLVRDKMSYNSRRKFISKIVYIGKPEEFETIRAEAGRRAELLNK